MHSSEVLYTFLILRKAQFSQLILQIMLQFQKVMIFMQIKVQTNFKFLNLNFLKVRQYPSFMQMGSILIFHIPFLKILILEELYMEVEFNVLIAIHYQLQKHNLLIYMLKLEELSIPSNCNS